MNISNERKENIWKTIIEEEKKNITLQENEMTVAMFAEKLGMSKKSARIRLRELVEEGKLDSYYKILNGAKAEIFVPKE